MKFAPPLASSLEGVTLLQLAAICYTSLHHHKTEGNGNFRTQRHSFQSRKPEDESISLLGDSIIVANTNYKKVKKPLLVPPSD